MNAITALLPMKANSDRVPGKNFKDLAGKPLFRWILDTLLSVDAISQVIINTDATDILRSKGLEESDRVVIHQRPEELCGDLVSMNLIIENDIERSRAEHFLMTHTTNPLISSRTVRAAVHKYQSAVESGDHDSLFSVNRYQTRFYREDGSAINHDPDNLIRTQDLEPWFEENSCLYLFSRDSFAATNARIGQHPVLFETPPMESVDIDGESDWNLAELFAKQIDSNEACR